MFNIVKKGASILIFKTKKNSPAILMAGAGVAGVATIVSTIKATMKLDDILDEHQAKMDLIHDTFEDVKANDERNEAGEILYSEDDVKKDTAKLYLRTCGKICKLYFPTIVLSAVTVGCVLTSHKIMKKRNLALLAAYKELHNAYSNYRNKVISKYGEDADREILFDGVDRETEVDDKGNVVSSVGNDRSTCSTYARFFDSSCPDFKKNPDYNKTFVEETQRMFNDKLRANGSVFLNEVYDALGFQRTPAGAIVGWIDGGDGDNYIDFGIYEDRNRRFVNGLEPVVLLDFNVDGVIYDKI